MYPCDLFNDANAFLGCFHKLLMTRAELSGDFLFFFRCFVKIWQEAYDPHRKRLLVAVPRELDPHKAPIFKRLFESILQLAILELTQVKCPLDGCFIPPGRTCHVGQMARLDCVHGARMLIPGKG